MKKVVRLLLRSLTLLMLVLIVSAAGPNDINKFMPEFDEFDKILDYQDVNGSNVNRFVLLFCRNSIELSLLNLKAFSPDEETILANAYLNYEAEDYIRYFRQVDIPNSGKANGTILLWKDNEVYIVTLIRRGLGYVFTPNYLIINQKEAQSGN